MLNALLDNLYYGNGIIFSVKLSKQHAVSHTVSDTDVKRKRDREDERVESVLMTRSVLKRQGRPKGRPAGGRTQSQSK